MAGGSGQCHSGAKVCGQEHGRHCPAAVVPQCATTHSANSGPVAGFAQLRQSGCLRSPDLFTTSSGALPRSLPSSTATGAMSFGRCAGCSCSSLWAPTIAATRRGSWCQALAPSSMRGWQRTCHRGLDSITSRCAHPGGLRSRVCFERRCCRLCTCTVTSASTSCAASIGSSPSRACRTQ